MILPLTAAKRIAENNGIDPELINIDEFEETAARLGYWRK
ncbi:glutaredoxin [Holdemania sp. Marseille-P2844]|nr:glutaredoxin [Holdemania sp. Marseille-P2844]